MGIVIWKSSQCLDTFLEINELLQNEVTKFQHVKTGTMYGTNTQFYDLYTEATVLT